MSDGGKGSRARPFAVDQETFSNRWDLIFNKGKQFPLETNQEVPQSCGCRKCLANKVGENGSPVLTYTFVVCSTCGNKRCPHATDHNLACTNSNEPGQPGSVYK